MKIYVDLGLPSGTRWASSNQGRLLNYSDALRRFVRRIPSPEEWRELAEYCTWIWDRIGGRYVVIGPSGRFIYLPAEGFICCAGKCHHGEGHYWSCRGRDASAAFDFHFNEKRRFPDDAEYKVLAMSVRTVRRPR